MAILDAYPDMPPAILTDALIQFGDWYQVKHQPEKALTYYRRFAGLVAKRESRRARRGGGTAGALRCGVYYPMPLLAMRNRQLSLAQIDEKFVSVGIHGHRSG